MKKFLGYLLLLSFVGSSTGLDQLFKMPVVFTHFLEHRAEEPGISFSNFLKMHFLNPGFSNHTHDHDHHQQLPFKNHDCSQHTDFLKIYQRKNLENTLNVAVKNCLVFTIPSKDNLPPNSFFTDIWNPPKA